MAHSRATWLPGRRAATVTAVELLPRPTKQPLDGFAIEPHRYGEVLRDAAQQTARLRSWTFVAALAATMTAVSVVIAAIVG